MSEKNIMIGKNAPEGLARLLEELAGEGNVNVTDFRKDIPDITAARNIQEKFKEKIEVNNMAELDR